MAILTQECLEKLKNKIDIVDLISSFLEVKRVGAYQKALCPFHDEKSPSFIVQPASNQYHCFGCQAHGDAIAFLMNHQRLNFLEAIEFLADRYQVLLEYENDNKPQVDKRRLNNCLETASNYFHNYLLTSKDGKQALEYLRNRNINEAFIKAFEIGLAPQNGNLFLSHMKDQKFTEKELLETQLITESKRSFFFDRIMFPIKDPRGQSIAFSARLYKETTGGGKYINSKESLLFKKSQVFYGLNYSRMRIAKEKKVLIVEGQIDALRLIESGLNATVAPLGTALTEQHIDKLNQLGVEKAYLCLDSDDAGVKAAIKSGNLLQKKGIEVLMITLPKDSDPDSIITSKGIDAFKKHLSQKRDYLTYLISYYSYKQDLNEPAQKARVVQSIAKQIKEWENPIMVFESLKKLAHLSQLPEETLGIYEVEIPHIYSSSQKTKNEFNPNQFLEADFLTWILKEDDIDKKWLKTSLNHLDEDAFIDPYTKLVFLTLKEHQNDTIDHLTLFMNINDSKAQKLITHLLEKKLPLDRKEELFIQALQKILDRNWMQKSEEIKVKIQSGMLSDDEAIDLAKQFDQIKKNRPKVNL